MKYAGIVIFVVIFALLMSQGGWFAILGFGMLVVYAYWWGIRGIRAKEEGALLKFIVALGLIIWQGLKFFSQSD